MKCVPYYESNYHEFLRILNLCREGGQQSKLNLTKVNAVDLLNLYAYGQ